MRYSLLRRDKFVSKRLTALLCTEVPPTFQLLTLQLPGLRILLAFARITVILRCTVRPSQLPPATGRLQIVNEFGVFNICESRESLSLRGTARRCEPRRCPAGRQGSQSVPAGGPRLPCAAGVRAHPQRLLGDHRRPPPVIAG